jgi:membrane-associated phospholipid phosphatase
MNAIIDQMKYIITDIEYIIDKGPDILLIVSVILLYLYKSFNYLTIYVCGYLIQELVVVVLKMTFKQPRPSENLIQFNSLIHNNKITNPNRFGMPSGHTSRALYSTIFIFFALCNIKITICYAIISIIIMYQRINSKQHSLFQVVIGGIIGIILGYYFYQFAFKNLQGISKMKKDDNAPMENGLV